MFCYSCFDRVVGCGYVRKKSQTFRVMCLTTVRIFVDTLYIFSGDVDTAMLGFGYLVLSSACRLCIGYTYAMYPRRTRSRCASRNCSFNVHGLLTIIQNCFYLECLKQARG